MKSGGTRRRWKAVALGVAVVAVLGVAGVAGYVHALRTLALPWRTVATGSAVKSLAFSPSGDVLAVMGQDAVVRVFDASDGRLVRSFVAAREKGVSLAFLPDGERLVCSAESSVKLWSWREGKCLRTFPEHPHEIGVVAVSPDGSRVAATASDGKVRLWSSDGFLIRVSRELDALHRLCAIAFRKDDQRLLVGYSTGVVALDEKLEPREHWGDPSWEESFDLPLALAPSPTTSEVVVASLGGVRLLSGALEPQAPIESARDPGVGSSVAWSADGESIVGTDHSGRVHVWSTRPGTPGGPRSHAIASIVAVSPRGDRIASGDGEGSLKLWWMPRR